MHVPVNNFPPLNVATAVVSTDIAPFAVLLVALFAHPIVFGILTLKALHSCTLNASDAVSTLDDKCSFQDKNCRTLLISCITILVDAA